MQWAAPRSQTVNNALSSHYIHPFYQTPHTVPCRNGPKLKRKARMSILVKANARHLHQPKRPKRYVTGHHHKKLLTHPPGHSFAGKEGIEEGEGTERACSSRRRPTGWNSNERPEGTVHRVIWQTESHGTRFQRYLITPFAISSY